MFRLAVSIFVFALASCAVEPDPGPDRPLCSEQWFQFVEEALPTGDSEGHGPDLGSMEWRSVVEFKLGIRGDTTIPSRKTDQWCIYINQRISESDL